MSPVSPVSSSLSSGCGSALPDGIDYPSGSTERFPPSCQHYMTFPFPRLGLAHRSHVPCLLIRHCNRRPRASPVGGKCLRLPGEGYPSRRNRSYCGASHPNCPAAKRQPSSTGRRHRARARPMMQQGSRRSQPQTRQHQPGLGHRGAQERKPDLRQVNPLL
jgi:hypothetical protein